MANPKFRYVRRHAQRDIEPVPGVWARAVLALRLGAVLAVIIAIVAYLWSLISGIRFLSASAQSTSTWK